MKKLLALSMIVVLAAMSVWVSTQASAAGFVVASDNGDAVISVNDTVDSTAFMAGKTVRIDGTVKGDVFCAGETVLIKGTVEGDVICGASTVTIEGVVKGDVRVAGATVVINGQVAGNVTAAGSDVSFGKSFTGGRDITAAGSTVLVAGTVTRDAFFGSEQLHIDGSIGRDVSASAGNMSVSEDAKVGGNVWYEAATKSETVSEKAVAGTVTFSQLDQDKQPTNNLTDYLVGILMLMALTVLVVLIAPRYVHIAALQPLRVVLLCFLLGLAAVILLPVLAILLIATGIGLLFGLVLLLVWLTLMMTAFAFVSYYVGNLVLQKRATNAVVVAAVGSAVVGLLLIVPFVNALVFMVGLFSGVGMQLWHIKYQFSKNPYSIAS